MKARIFNKFETEKIKQFYLNEDKTLDYISKYFKVTSKTIKNVLLSHGITLRKFSKEGKEKLRQLYLGKTIEELYGEKKANEIKDKLSKISKGIPKTIEHNLKNSLANKGIPKSLEARKKHSASLQGIPLEKWEKFISKEPYGEEFNLQLKNQIRKRDNQICMNCGIHREKLKQALTIHHINYDKGLNVFENLISLCRSCHTITNYNREYWQSLFQEKLTKTYNYEYNNQGNIIINMEIKNEI